MCIRPKRFPLFRDDEQARAMRDTQREGLYQAKGTERLGRRKLADERARAGVQHQLTCAPCAGLSAATSQNSAARRSRLFAQTAESSRLGRPRRRSSTARAHNRERRTGRRSNARLAGDS